MPLFPTAGWTIGAWISSVNKKVETEKKIRGTGLEGVCKPDSGPFPIRGKAAVIPLGRPLPADSSDAPGGSAGSALLLVLLQVGFAEPTRCRICW